MSSEDTKDLYLRTIFDTNEKFIINPLRICFAYLLIICTASLSYCKPATLNNPADPNSRSFFENAVVLCALGVYDACKSCKPAPGPWGTFVGTPTVGQTISIQMRTDNEYNLYSLTESPFNFGSGGINFLGTQGTDNNFFLTKFSPTGERQWLSYFGRRSDRPKGVIVNDNDGIYSYVVTETSTLPNAITSHTNSGLNSLIIKHSFDGNILWTRHYNDGTNADFTYVTHLMKTEDNSGILVFGSTENPLVNPGEVIVSATGTSWFIQKIDYNGNPIWTRYYSFTGGYLNYKIYKVAKLSDNKGYAILSYVTLDVNTDFGGGLNTYVGNSTVVPLVMKLNESFEYQWHRYLGGDVDISAVDDTAPIILPLPMGRFALTSLFADPVPTTGKPYPGASNSSVVYYMNAEGDVLSSSFIVDSGQSMIILDGIQLDNGRFLVSGSLNVNGFISELNPENLTEEYRLLGQESVRSSSIKHCDGSFSTGGYATSSIPDALLPFGSGTTNAYFSRFKP